MAYPRAVGKLKVRSHMLAVRGSGHYQGYNQREDEIACFRFGYCRQAAVIPLN